MFQRPVTYLLAGIAVSFLVAFTIHGEESHDPGATRQLYLLGGAPADPLGNRSEKGNAAVKNLGFQYHLVLVDTHGKHQRVSPDRVFRTGDCVALELQSNRSGYLYVLARQSSGAWTPLIPSPEMTGEINVIDPGKSVIIPRGYCFAIHDPPGTETLFVVLSRDSKDFYELYEGIKGKARAEEPNRLNAAISHMTEKFGTRDLAVQKVPADGGETDETSVYVVSSSNKPVASVVKTVQIRHR